ncbi:MAG: transglycosylase SLT domain-containing protein [Chromatiales bacterium]|nr:transglycosylase SLT domain-containing protein [Chromatiales bacterium]
MQRRLTLLVLSLLGATAASGSDADLEKQRGAFRDAWIEAERGDWRAVQPRLDELEGYPLLPDLEAVYFRATVKQQPNANIERFLATNETLWIAPSLRLRWINSLAQRNDWQRFLEVYRSHYADAGNTRLDCVATEAMAQTGDAGGFAREARRLWLVGISQPKECDSVFSRLRETGQLTDDLVLQRLDLALEAEQFGLAAYLARQLDDAQRQRVKRWQRMRDRAETELATPKPLRGADRDPALVIYGLDRLARNEPDIAAQLLPHYAAANIVDNAEQQRLERKIALWSARKYLPAGLERVHQLDESAVDDDICVAWTRAALRSSAWHETLAAIDAMSAEEAGDSAWLYWRARALAKTGEPEAAAAIFERLAAERGYHSFLAADRLDLPYNFGHKPAAADDAVIDALEQRPDIVRARELFAVGLDSAGRVEWQRAVARLDRDTRAQAAIMAHRWGWHSRAIATGSANGLIDDLDIRFPAPYLDLYQSLSPRANIAISWAYGITRSESLFMRDVSSPAGAIGLMQLMPATGASTARQINLRYSGSGSLTDPQVNIALGTTYLGKMLARFDGNQVLATAAYNAGPKRVERWLPEDLAMPADIWVETIPFRETRGYVKRVMAAETVFLWRLNGTVSRLSLRMPMVAPAAGSDAVARR